ncbi:MAG: type II toxin-antitoxin system VapC family toxin [Gammaproteobacteria bacterium]
MIYLDTHVVVWLYAGFIERLSSSAIQLIENNSLFISPIVELELTYLHEIKRITRKSHVIIHDLQTKIGLKICELSFEAVTNKAITQSWTRDPLDRIIVSHALCNEARLLTKDKTILKHCKLAIWE